jgi:hypothetical protein
MSTTLQRRRSAIILQVCWSEPKPFQLRENLTGRTESYSIKGRQESQQNQEIEYHVHTLRLRAEQQHNLQLDSSFVPTPILNGRLSQSFCVSSDTTVK